MSEKPKLVDLDAYVARDCIKKLENLIERAKAGEVEQYAIVTVSPRGRYATQHSIWDYGKVLGGIELLRDRVVRDWDANTDGG